MKKFFTGYLVGLLVFGLIFFGVSSKLSPKNGFRPQPIQFEGVELEEIQP